MLHTSYIAYTYRVTGLEIYISRQWTIGPPALEIWWSCQISGGPDVANCIFFWQNQTQLTEFTFSHTRLIYEKTLQYIYFIEKDMTLVKKKCICVHLVNVIKILFFND